MRQTEAVATGTSTTSGLIEALSKDLSSGKLEIPGFPDIAMRLNRALRSEDASMKEIVALINSEPGLVSRLLQVSNSAAFNASGRSIADLKTAVGRLGFKIVMSAASSYSIRQMEQHEWLQPVRPWLAEIWWSSNAVAAICFVVGKKLGRLGDEAMVAGLLHRVGDLYLVTQAQKRNIDIQNDPTWDKVMAKWGSTTASEMLLQWGLPAHIADAVGRQDDVANGDIADLTSFAALLSAAKLYNSSVRDQQATDQASEAVALLETVNLWGHPFLKAVEGSKEQIEAIRTAIG